MTTSQRRIHHRLPSAGSLGWPALLLVLSLVFVACGGDDDEPEPATAEPTAVATEEAETASEPADDADAGGDEASAGDDESADSETAETASEPADDRDAGADAGGDEASAGDDESADSEVPDALVDLASDSGSATVTIGDEAFEFSLAGTQTIDGTTYVGRCQSLFGMIIGSGFAADGRDITIDLEIPPVDWETYEDDRFDPPAVEVEDNVNNAKWVADEGDELVSGGTIGEYEQEGVVASGSATFVNEWATDSEPVEGTFEVDCAA